MLWKSGTNKNETKLEHSVAPDQPNVKDQQKQPSIHLPCDHYEYEFNMCSSFMNKVNNYYRGVESDPDRTCESYKNLFLDCVSYERNPGQNFDALLRLKAYEKQMLEKRRQSAENNDVWTKRTSPPSDWNAPLPDWCMERLKQTVWYKKQENNKPASTGNQDGNK